MISSSLEGKIEQYLTFLQNVKRASPDSIRNYRSTLYQFLTFIQTRKVSSTEISSFLVSLDLKATSANAKAVRLRGFLDWSKVEMDIPRAKEPFHLVETLTTTEIESLLSHLEGSTRQAVVLLSGTGLRWSEFISLSPQSVFFQPNELGLKWPSLRIFGKGSKERIVPLTSKAYEAFKSLCPPINSGDEKRLRRAMRTAGVKAGLSTRIRPHLFRATFISHLLNVRKAEAIQVANLVGHSNLNTMLKHYYKPTIDSLHDLVGE